MKGWDPFRDLLAIQDRMNKLFESVLTGPAPLAAEGETVGVFEPPADVVDGAERYEVFCELPGLDRDEIDLRVDEQTLLIQGTRRRDADGEGNYLRLERPTGRFLRRFDLPAGLDIDHVDAALEEGMLHVSLPKRPESRARTVPVSSAGGNH